MPQAPATVQTHAPAQPSMASYGGETSFGQPSMTSYAGGTSYAQPTTSSYGGGSSFAQPPSAEGPSLTLLDRDYIHVTLKKLAADITSNVYQFETDRGWVEKTGAEFSQNQHQDGNPCMVYYGATSQRYY